MLNNEVAVASLLQYREALLLDEYLGNPLDENTAFSFKNSIIIDEKEEYPESISKLLNDYGVNNFYIPEAFGGKLKNIEELSMILRMISRRDLTVSIAHGGKLLGLMPIWNSKTEHIKQESANFIQENNKIALGLTEHKHGSDILNNDVTAIKLDDGYVLNGEKWLIGHATIGGAISILAKTNNKGGARGFTLFYINKEKIISGSIYNPPKIKTMGTRGLDMSGIGFKDVVVPKNTLISDEGKGLDSVLKGLQFTRNLCSAFSLGATDTVLRSITSFTKERQLYDSYVIKLPIVQETLLDTFLAIIASDCLSIAINRAFHVLPEQCSLYSAIAKAIIPDFLENQITKTSKIQGARFYLRDEYHFGIIQKMLRDNVVIGLGDGNTAINLHSVISQLKAIYQRDAKIQRDAIEKNNKLID